MKFLVDTQLPLRLVTFLNERGHDAIHTSSLPEGNRSKDRAIAEMADDEGRVVVSKDTHRGRPAATAGCTDHGHHHVWGDRSVRLPGAAHQARVVSLGADGEPGNVRRFDLDTVVPA